MCIEVCHAKKMWWNSMKNRSVTENVWKWVLENWKCWKNKLNCEKLHENFEINILCVCHRINRFFPLLRNHLTMAVIVWILVVRSACWWYMTIYNGNVVRERENKSMSYACFMHVVRFEHSRHSMHDIIHRRRPVYFHVDSMGFALHFCTENK